MVAHRCDFRIINKLQINVVHSYMPPDWQLSSADTTQSGRRKDDTYLSMPVTQNHCTLFRCARRTEHYFTHFTTNLLYTAINSLISFTPIVRNSLSLKIPCFSSNCRSQVDAKVRYTSNALVLPHTKCSPWTRWSPTGSSAHLHAATLLICAQKIECLSYQWGSSPSTQLSSSPKQSLEPKEGDYIVLTAADSLDCE